MPVTPELQKYVSDARGFGMTDDQIRTELKNSGWSSADVDSVVGVSRPNPVASVAPVTRPQVSQNVTPQNKTVFNPAVTMGGAMASFNPAPQEGKSYLKWVIIISLLVIFLGGTVGIYFIMPELKDKIVNFVSSKISIVVKNLPFGKSEGIKNSENNNPNNVAPLVSDAEIVNQNNINPVVMDVSSSTVAQVVKITPEEAWVVYDKYIAGLQEKAKTGSVKLLNEVSLVPFKECDKAKISECKKAATTAIGLIGISDKSVFVNNVADDKQVILYTNLKPNNKGSYIGFEKKLLYFAKDESGTLKIAKAITKNFSELKSSSDSEIKLNSMVIDSDNDGLTDQEETAACPKSDTKCVNTDPNKMDTDGNGYWDSIDKYKNEIPK